MPWSLVQLTPVWLAETKVTKPPLPLSLQSPVPESRLSVRYPPPRPRAPSPAAQLLPGPVCRRDVTREAAALTLVGESGDSVKMGPGGGVTRPAWTGDAAISSPIRHEHCTVRHQMRRCYLRPAQLYICISLYIGCSDQMAAHNPLCKLQTCCRGWHKVIFL